MSVFVLSRRACAVAASLALLSLSAARADEIRVMSSSGFGAALKALCAAYQQKTGTKVDIMFGPSMGETPQAIPNRLARGEPVDVVVIVKEALAKLADDGKIVLASRVDLAASRVGIAVRAGAPKPDISTVDAFKQSLLAAKSIAVSDSASGVYLSSVLFPKLDPTGAIKAKTQMIPAKPVGAVIAQGGADIGFQQMSELIPVKGIDIVGAVPPSIDKVTMFTAGIGKTATNAAGGEALIKFLSSTDAVAAIKQSGMQPASDVN